MVDHSLPDLFLERLHQIVPQSFWGQGDFLFQAKQEVSFRINTLKVSIDALHAQLRAEGIAFKLVSWYSSVFIVSVSDSKVLLSHALASDGKIYAQASSSMVPVIALDPQPDERVLDLCAAPGSKTSQMAAHMNNEGLLVANEAIRARFYRLKAVTELMGAKVKLNMCDGRRFNMPHDGAFDRILVDAPCSSEGRFDANDVDSFKYWGKRKIEEMSHKQKGLLLNASRLLKSGGILVYATCTFAPEENEEVVDWFLRKAEGRFTVEVFSLPGINSYPALGVWGKRVYDPQVSRCLRILPDTLMEGFFVAKFRSG